MKPLIDINRLNYLILRGRDSYSDGRNEFKYELLCDLMERLGVRMYCSHGLKRQRARKRFPKPSPWCTTHEWQIQVVSKFDWLEDDLGDNEDEPYDKGVHVVERSFSAKEILSRFRFRKRVNPYENWSIKLVRKIQPNLP